MRRRLLLFALCCLVAACSPRGEITRDPAARGIGTERPIYFATTRQWDPEAQTYGPLRSSRVHFGRIDISVPPIRKTGTIRWPRGEAAPDPRRDFVTLELDRYDNDAEFRRNIAEALRRTPEARGEVVVFIHGYNNTFADATYRLAQLQYDLKVPSIPVVYSWPSKANVFGYVYDRDSVLFARDGLEKTLDDIVAAGARRIVLVGHSLGTELTMEVLRQMTLDGNRKVMSRIAGVTLMSPDIDTQLFRRQAKRIGKLPQPFLIFTSSRDKALALSATLTGRSSRLGNIRDLDKVSELEVTVIDVSAFSRGGGHFTTGNSPTLLQILTNLGDIADTLSDRGSGLSGLLPGIVQTVHDATEVVVEPLTGMDRR